MSAYLFRAVTRADLPLLARWRAAPHVARWWGPPDPGEDEETIDDPCVLMWIVEHQGRPFAYAQDYSPHDWRDHHFGHLPPGSRGIDQYIGEEDMLGQGHGSAFVRAHCERLFAAGAPAIGTDPDPGNARAISAYRKAGFAVAAAALDTPWGHALPMENWRI